MNLGGAGDGRMDPAGADRPGTDRGREQSTAQDDGKSKTATNESWGT